MNTLPKPLTNTIVFWAAKYFYWFVHTLNASYNSGVSVGLDWFGVSVGTGSSVYLRNVTRAYSDSVTLPVIDIVT